MTRSESCSNEQRAVNDTDARVRRERDAGATVCVRCIMDTSDPEIVFDERGICNHCRRYDARVAAEIAPSEERERKLKALCEEIRRASRGKNYDCVIGVSGGVD